MKELIVISGKGGTGKTSIVSAFASLAKDSIICDADVDAADLYLIMKPNIKRREEFQSGHTAIINKEKCTECGLCRDLCRWDAISEDFVVDSIDCEGCGVCFYFCPEKAIDFPLNSCGEWFISETRFGPLVHARLYIAEENSGKLVTMVRQEAKKLAEEKGAELIITDGPPGIGCPVIASIGGASLVLIVTEPTVSGQHDMERVYQLAAHFNVPALVCVNKADLNPDAARIIENYSIEKGLRFVGNIPFDENFTKAMVEEKTIIEFDPNSHSVGSIKEIWDRVLEELKISSNGS